MARAKVPKLPPASSQPVAGVRPSLHLVDGRAVLVERGRGVTELGPEPVHHALDIESVEEGPAGALTLLDSAGGIHRYVPGAPPRRWWQVAPDLHRVTAIGLTDDRLVVQRYGRWWHRFALIDTAAGRRCWRRTGTPEVASAGDDLIVGWRRHNLLDGAVAVSRVDGASGRDRWRLERAVAVAAITAHPAHAVASRLVIRIRGEAPSPPSWPPTLLAVVGDRAWFRLVGGHLGSYLVALDLDRGELAAAVGLRACVPEGLVADGHYHMHTVGTYEVFDLRRDGALVAEASFGNLPSLQCRLVAILDGARVLMASRFGHLLTIDRGAPSQPRILWHTADHYVGDPVIAGGRMYVLHHPLGGKPGHALVTMDAP